MMMTWGFFTFGLSSAAYQELQRSATWKLPKNTRVGKRDGVQFIGPGTETITLTGELRPEITGGRSSIELVRRMADLGEAWPLIERTGKFYGLFTCDGIDDSMSDFFDDGMPRKIDFTIKLTRVDDSEFGSFATLASIISFF